MKLSPTRLPGDTRWGRPWITPLESIFSGKENESHRNKELCQGTHWTEITRTYTQNWVQMNFQTFCSFSHISPTFWPQHGLFIPFLFQLTRSSWALSSALWQSENMSDSASKLSHHSSCFLFCCFFLHFHLLQFLHWLFYPLFIGLRNSACFLLCTNWPLYPDTFSAWVLVYDLLVHALLPGMVHLTATSRYSSFLTPWLFQKGWL